LLEERGVDYRYRDTKRDPLSVGEIRDVLRRLGQTANELLRTRDPAFKELGLAGDEPEERLVQLMAVHPTLLQRPIGVVGERAAVGRPPEALLELL